jgi:hypothetical protein
MFMPTDAEVHYHMVKSKKLNFPEPRKEADQYERSIGPERPTTGERIRGAVSRVTGNQYVQGAVGAVKNRSREIAEESREHHGRGQRISPRVGGMGSSPSMPHDPFGVGSMGGFMSDPFHEAPTRKYNDTPRKKKKRRGRYAPSNTSGPQMFGIPRGMEHLF